jgi:hypothetical protein
MVTLAVGALMVGLDTTVHSRYFARSQNTKKTKDSFM